MKPKFIAIAAVTMDGKIARTSRSGSSWTSKEDKDFLHRELDRCNLIVVGRKTYEHAKKPLKKRNCLVMTRRVKGWKKRIKSLTGRVCILGGSQIYSWFLRHELIDEIFLTVEPIIFGAGVPLFDIALKVPQHYILVSIKRLNKNGTIVLHYKKS